MHYELYTLCGKTFLDHARVNIGKKELPALDFSEDIVLSYETREDSAVFYQLGVVLNNEITAKTADRFEKIWFYLDFSSAQPIEEEPFSKLFNDGFYLAFDGGKPVHYVPFVTSQSQSKKFVYSFVRSDVFGSLLPRLDLDLPLEKDARNKSLAYLAKLYAYRALYMSSATEVLRCSDKLGAEFFNCENIIVLPEKEHNVKARVFTANSTKKLSAGGDAVLETLEAEDVVSLNCFDGAGIISKSLCETLNSLLPKKLKGNSFQVRMPFFKGVLHSVDFHKFIKDKFAKAGLEEPKEAFVTDVFGKQRDLLRANVVVRPSVFKLEGLLGGFFANTADRDEYFKTNAQDGDIMKYYFEKLHKYNHALYIVKSEKSFKNTQFVHLSSQQLSTFDLGEDDLDGIVGEHIAFANSFTVENLKDGEKRKELLSIEDKTAWMELLLKDERFLKDPHVKAMVDSHRISLLNNIALGKILAKGENRFLCGDLYVFLVDMIGRITKDGGLVFPDAYKNYNEKNRFLSNGGVYLPGGKRSSGEKVALIRSPHLSRNEDVCTIAKQKGDYEEYLGHLTGVAFTGDTSFIPAALGGADFDGDHISVIYDRRISDACLKSGYTEIHKVKSAVPFINIKPIKVELPPEKAKIERYNYVCPKVVYTTFSNRIGQISNTAMKIAAVEYDPALKKSEGLPGAAFCTILTGNEIDATKKGVRPYIDDVQKFAKGLEPEAREVVKEIERYIEMKRELENKKGEVPEISMDEEGNLCLPETSFLPVKVFKPNRGRNAVAQLLYRWAKAFYDFKVAEEDTSFDRQTLLEIFGAKPKKATLCKTVTEAYRSADTAFADLQKKMKDINAQDKKLAAMVTVRLKGQYDNVYSYTAEEPSYKDRFDIFLKELSLLAEETEKKELEDLKNYIYSAGSKTFDAQKFWPYSKNENIKENALLERILALPNAEMLFNFNFEGYRLLHYALEKVIARKTDLDFTKKSNKNEYTKKYFGLFEVAAKTHVSKAKFEKTLADIAIQDLADIEGLDIWYSEQLHELIARMYPSYDASLTKTFWKIFGEDDVLEALGGKVNA